MHESASDQQPAAAASLSALDIGTPAIENENGNIVEIIELPMFRLLVDRATDLADRWGVFCEAVVAVALHRYLESEPTKAQAEVDWDEVMDEYLWSLPEKAWGESCCGGSFDE